MDGIFYVAGGTVESAIEDLFFIFILNPESKISLADRTAEDIHE